MHCKCSKCLKCSTPPTMSCWVVIETESHAGGGCISSLHKPFKRSLLQVPAFPIYIINDDSNPLNPIPTGTQLESLPSCHSLQSANNPGSATTAVAVGVSVGLGCACKSARQCGALDRHIAFMSLACF